MSREFHLIGLGNSLVDILLELTDEEFAPLAFEKGTMRLVEPPEQQKCSRRSATTSRGSSAAGAWPTRSSRARNSAARARSSAASATTATASTTPKSSPNSSIDFANAPLVGETTGTCVSIITPDAERTMRTCLAVSSHLAARHVPADEDRRQRSGCSSKGTCSPTRAPASTRSSEAVRAAKAQRHEDRAHLFGSVHSASVRRRRSARP